MRHQSYGLILLSTLALLSGCNPVVNFFAFHANSSYILPTESLPLNTTEVFLRTNDDVRIQALHLSNPSSDKITIFFHGNAGNIYHRLGDYQILRQLGTSVLAVSYRGYAKSDGSPSEAGLYLDGYAAFDYAVNTLGYPPSRIVIFGRSIGSTVAVDLAQDKSIAGLVLISPLSNGHDQSSAMGLGFASALAGDAFANDKKIKRLKAPLMIIHGSHDRIIPINMGRKTFDAAPQNKTFHEITGAGHNDLTTRYHDKYWNFIAEFINTLP
jgi:fermentation-respiration switch protein FrsA (DUF1100 family)